MIFSVGGGSSVGMAGEPSHIGPYQIGKRLGQGGMGAVYEAVHDTIGRRAAVKFLNAPLAKHAATLNRFFNEARAVSLVEHPGLVQIYDSGQLADGTAYIIMELIRGETLADRLKRERRLPVTQTLRLGWQLADALAAVHEQEIVHRDIKPANLMIVPDPAATGRERLKVLDFGIAKLATGIGAGETRPGQVMGSPVYMAPEQCRGAAGVDAKADAYAVGAVLYHMLAGQPPFDGETFAALVFKHLHEPLTPLTEHRVEGPPDLIACVHALLSKDPKGRPTMRETAVRLEGLLNSLAVPPSTLSDPRPGNPTTVNVVAPKPEDATRLHIDLGSTLGQSVGQAPSFRFPLPRRALGAFALAVLAVPLLLLLLWPSSPPPPVVPATAKLRSDPAGREPKAPDNPAPVAAAAASAKSRPQATATAAAVDKSSPAATRQPAAPAPAVPSTRPASKPSAAAKPGPAPSAKRPPAPKGNKSLGKKTSFPIIQ